MESMGRTLLVPNTYRFRIRGSGLVDSLEHKRVQFYKRGEVRVNNEHLNFGPKTVDQCGVGNNNVQPHLSSEDHIDPSEINPGTRTQDWNTQGEVYIRTTYNQRH